MSERSAVFMLGEILTAAVREKFPKFVGLIRCTFDTYPGYGEAFRIDYIPEEGSRDTETMIGLGSVNTGKLILYGAPSLNLLVRRDVVQYLETLFRLMPSWQVIDPSRPAREIFD